MKVNRLIVELLIISVTRAIKRRRKIFPPMGVFKEFLDVPYLDDGKSHHQYDVFLTTENRKNVCILDVHGGSYLFSGHRDNYIFAYEFLKEGYDVICLDYLPNDGKRDTKDLVSDCVLCLNHIYEHLKDFSLEDDKFVMTGDSAGGHFALLLSEMMEDKKIQDLLGFNLHNFNLKGVLLNCPVYDFEWTGYNQMTHGAMKRMFGKNYSLEKMRLLSPREYIKDFKLPLFVSTCKNDFIRKESLKLNEDMKQKDNKFVFIDIDSDNKKVDHVHNVVAPYLEESKRVNQKMLEFIETIIK